jgi:hypothetical protein
MAYSRRSRPTKEQLLADRETIWPESGACPLCGRPLVAGKTVNEHHLIPRMYGGTERHAIHRVCHSKIHSVFNEAELAKVYNTFEKLRSHPELVSFIKWIRKQDPEFTTRHRRPRELR